MTRYRIRHITRYKYAERVTRCYNLAHVVPRNTHRQRCIKTTVSVSPTPARSQKRSNYFDNIAYHFEIQKAHTELEIKAESEVQVEDRNQDLNLDLGTTYHHAQDFLRSTLNPDTIDARQYLLGSTMIEISAALADYAQPSFAPDRSLKSCVSDLTSRIFHDFAYDPNSTTVATPLADVLAQRRGVCQDFAHLQIGCLRAMGVPARYVSGYIETLPKPGEKKLVGSDATHAWIAYYCPDEGWLEFDPTNNTQANSQHIVTAFGRDYFDVTPVRGVIFGGGRLPILEVSVDVARLP
ncbi:MAG: transglutaminase family protein [Halioglobus sp.]